MSQWISPPLSASALNAPPFDGALLQPYLLGAFVCSLVAIFVLLILRFRLRDRRSDGLLSDNVFNAFFGDASVGIAVVDEHGAIARTNAVFEGMTGYEQAALVGKLYVDLVFDPTDAAGRDRVVGALDRFGESHTLTICRKDGSFFRARFIVSPAPASLSRNQSVIFVEEVGPDRDRDREPLQTEDDGVTAPAGTKTASEATINGRTGPSSGATSWDSKGYLPIPILDDELLTPLTVIEGYLSLLDGIEERDHSEAVDAIRTGVAQLSSRLDSLLYFARLQSGEVMLAEETVNVNRLVEDCVGATNRKHNDAAPIRLVGPNRQIEIVSDPAALEIIIGNLLDNAIRFGDSRDVSLSFSSQAGRLVLCVSNVGGGFDPSMRSSVFESFFQVSSGPARKYRGFGLGLTVVQNLVEQLSGSVAVSSEQDKGATFLVSVPVDAAMSRLGKAA